MEVSALVLTFALTNVQIVKRSQVGAGAAVKIERASYQVGGMSVRDNTAWLTLNSGC